MLRFVGEYDFAPTHQILLKAYAIDKLVTYLSDG